MVSLSIIGLSVCLYTLVSLNSVFGELSREAGLKYFILSALSSGLVLGGIKEMFICCGSLNFLLLNNYLLFKLLDFSFQHELFALKVGSLLIFAGFLFKLSAAPSHFWAPEVYAGLPYALINFLILPVKLAISGIFLRIFRGVFFIPSLSNCLNQLLYTELDFVVLIVCLCSMFIGGFHAVYEQILKRFLAYSSINQIGFLFIGLLGFTKPLFGAQSYIYFLGVYAPNLGSLFFLLSIICSLYSVKMPFLNKTKPNYN